MPRLPGPFSPHARPLLWAPMLLLLLLLSETLHADGGEELEALLPDDECFFDEASLADGAAEPPSAACVLSVVQRRAASLRHHGEALRRASSLGGSAEADMSAAGTAVATAAESAFAAARYFDGRAAAAAAAAAAPEGAEGPLRGLTPAELARYRQRFLLHVSALQGSSVLAEAALEAALFNQEPAITRRLVEEVNATDKDWKAGLPKWADNLTMQDLKTLMGHIEDPTLEEVPSGLDTDLGAAPEDGVGLPESFDSREEWPRCKEVFDQVRDQGKCGSCWAFAAAGTMDGRLCIASSAEFSGPRALISAAYLTSCYNINNVLQGNINGCSGGNPGSALEAAVRGVFNSGGVPTGGPRSMIFGTSHTCVPWFGSGSALEHFAGEQQIAPACPTACTNSDYPRTLAADKFYPTGKVQITRRFEDMQRALVQGGPLPFALTVYRDFMTYMGGYYSPVTAETVGGHSAVVLGYTKYKGADYVIAMNSWGRNWGDGTGIFNIEAGCCDLSYYLPQIGGDQPALPLPGGPGSPSPGTAASEDGKTCRKKTGGVCLFLACHESRGPTHCTLGQCECQTGFCAQGGLCVARGTQSDGATAPSGGWDWWNNISPPWNWGIAIQNATRDVAHVAQAVGAR